MPSKFFRRVVSSTGTVCSGSASPPGTVASKKFGGVTPRSSRATTLAVTSGLPPLTLRRDLAAVKIGVLFEFCAPT